MSEILLTWNLVFFNLDQVFQFLPWKECMAQFHNIQGSYNMEKRRDPKNLFRSSIKLIKPWFNPFSTGILWKIGITEKTKHPNLNASILKTKTISQ